MSDSDLIKNQDQYSASIGCMQVLTRPVYSVFYSDSASIGCILVLHFKLTNVWTVRQFQFQK